MQNRVQWFWHLFRNSICFMCFWFGLEIQRLVYYKKSVFKYCTVSIFLDLLSSKKSSTAPYKSWKQFLQNSPERVPEEVEFCADFKNVLSLAKGKKNFTEKLIFQALLQKSVFLRINLWELLDARDLHILEISVKFCFFWYPVCPIFKKFFQL